MKKFSDVVTAEDFESSKIKGQEKRKKKMEEKLLRKAKQTSTKNTKKYAIEELRLLELEEENHY